MKINIAVSTDSSHVLSPNFYTLNELLQHLGLGSFEIHGQSNVEYNSKDTLVLFNGSKETTLDVLRDEHGTYTASLATRDIMYYSLDKFNRVKQGYHTTDRIPVPVLRSMRYREYRHDEEHTNCNPSRIVMTYKSKFSKGQTVHNYVSEIPITSCKNYSRSRYPD